MFFLEPISVHVTPEIYETDSGSEALFECKITGHPIETVTWAHNGWPINKYENIFISDDSRRINIQNLKKEDAGLYQCFAGNNKDQAYATSELILEGIFIL